ncbi:MAG: Rrf2 family transcriptional regulator [Acidobacteriota bacterium]
MQLSKGFDYAVRSLVHLGRLPEGATAELRVISASQKVPLSYLAKVMRNLVRAGLVTSTLGRDGGYRLRLPPGEITLMMVYEAMEGRMRLVACMDGAKDCAFLTKCAQAAVWTRLRKAVEDIFVETTLRDLVADSPHLGGSDPVSSKEGHYARAGA